MKVTIETINERIDHLIRRKNITIIAILGLCALAQVLLWGMALTNYNQAKESAGKTLQIIDATATALRSQLKETRVETEE